MQARGFNSMEGMGQGPNKKVQKRKARAVFSSSKKPPSTRPRLPDLAIHQILHFLPFKDAVRLSFVSKQHQGAWALFPSIDFVERPDDHNEEVQDYDVNEDDYVDEEYENHDQDVYDDANDFDQNRKFIKILKGYLECRENQQQEQPGGDDAALRKCRLRMVRYVRTRDTTSVVNKWIKTLFQKGVEELDISLENTRKFARILYEDRPKFYHSLPRTMTSFANASSLTSLNLEYIRINKRQIRRGAGLNHFPCLKTLSMKGVHLDEDVLYDLITTQSPVIESLSLTSCSFDESFEKRRLMSIVPIKIPTLKTLQFTRCSAVSLAIRLARNLESFTFIASEGGEEEDSSSSSVTIPLGDAFNLKHVYIQDHHQQLYSLSLNGCHENVHAILDTPDLHISSSLLSQPCGRIRARSFNGISWNHLMGFF